MYKILLHFKRKLSISNHRPKRNKQNQKTQTFRERPSRKGAHVDEVLVSHLTLWRRHVTLCQDTRMKSPECARPVLTLKRKRTDAVTRPFYLSVNFVHQQSAVTALNELVSWQSKIVSDKMCSDSLFGKVFEFIDRVRLDSSSSWSPRSRTNFAVLGNMLEGLHQSEEFLQKKGQKVLVVWSCVFELMIAGQW